MRAIRVQKLTRAGKLSRYFVWHFLTDDEATRCGLDLAEMVAIPIEETELDELPQLEGCQLCARTASDDRIGNVGYPEKAGLERWGNGGGAVKGRISKAGKLRQTGRSGHGNQLR